MDVKVIQAEIIGLPLARWLDAGRTSRVMARFDTAVQFEGQDGQMWAMTIHPNPGPFRMVVPSLPRWRTGTPILMEEKDDDLPDGVHWHTAVVWDPHPKRRLLNMGERRSAVRQMAEEISRWGLPETDGFWNLIAEAWDALGGAIREMDSLLLQSILTRLIGCGPGLTPAGDDLIQALLITLSTGDDRDRAAFRTLARWIHPLLTHTTRESRAFLEEAVHGWSFGPLRVLLEALPRVSPGTVASLLNVGASSGYAYALGVLMGLEANTPLKKSE